MTRGPGMKQIHGNEHVDFEVDVKTRERVPRP